MFHVKQRGRYTPSPISMIISVIKGYVTFLSLNKKVTKELSIGGGFLQRRPLLCTTPPKAEKPESFNNKAEMSRFPPIRPLSFYHLVRNRDISDEIRI